MTEAMRALEEAIKDWVDHPSSLKLHDSALARLEIQMGTLRRVLPILRAALAPGADGEVEAIRQRHTEMQEVYGDEAICPMGQRDRATLLDRDTRHVAEIARLSAELAAERERRVEVEGALAQMKKDARETSEILEALTAIKSRTLTKD